MADIENQNTQVNEEPKETQVNITDTTIVSNGEVIDTNNNEGGKGEEETTTSEKDTTEEKKTNLLRSRRSTKKLKVKLNLPRLSWKVKALTMLP